MLGKSFGDGEAAGGADSTHSQPGHGIYEDDCCSSFKAKLNKLELLFERFACRKWDKWANSTPSDESTLNGSISGETVRDSVVSESGKEKAAKYVFGLPEIPTDSQSISQSIASVGDSIVWSIFSFK